MMKLSIVHLKIIQVSLFIRAIVFILAFISRQIIHPSYDSSNLSKDLDWFGFGNWDAVHFQQIANHGYRVEQNFAFYPIWPIVLGTLGNSSILPLLFQLLTALVLFELTKEMSKDQGFAYKSAVLFSLSPAAIFYSAKYTEAIFAFFTITGLYFVQRQKIGFATVCFAVGSGIRSNGVLYCGYLIYPLLNYLIRDKKYVKLHVIYYSE
jgi:phosphatidylinositol glycan class V